MGHGALPRGRIYLRPDARSTFTVVRRHRRLDTFVQDAFVIVFLRAVFNKRLGLIRENSAARIEHWYRRRAHSSSVFLANFAMQSNGA